VDALADRLAATGAAVYAHIAAPADRIAAPAEAMAAEQVDEERQAHQLTKSDGLIVELRRQLDAQLRQDAPAAVGGPLSAGRVRGKVLAERAGLVAYPGLASVTSRACRWRCGDRPVVGG
jgi:hypothetical protein